MKKYLWLSSASALFLLTPLSLFIYGWLKVSISIPLLVILIVFMAIAIRDLLSSIIEARVERMGESFSLWMVAIPLLGILFWLLLSGTGGFGYQNADYLASNALLKDLIDQPWPLQLQWNGKPAPVVYYVGWYLPAALVGKIFGWSAGNVFSLIWSYIGVLLSFGWFLRACNLKNINLIKMIGVLAVFCLADGMNLLMANSGSWEIFQYSAQTTLIYWVPQHTVPAWIITGLVIDCIDGNLSSVKYLGISIASCAISSPFGVLGIVPYLVVILFLNWQGEQRWILFSWKSIVLNLLAVPIILIGFLFLSSNKFAFPKGFIWEFSNSPIIFIAWLVFCLVEFGILSGLVFAGLWSDGSLYLKKAAGNLGFKDYLAKVHGVTNTQYTIFILAVIVLFLLPLYKLGYRDDFVMRGSIPSLFIFWSFISKILTDSGFYKGQKIRLIYLMIICSMIIGSHISSVQIWQSVTHYHLGPPDENSVLTTVTANPERIVEQRIGNSETFFYRYLGK
jgi:hypothetical protein